MFTVIMPTFNETPQLGLTLASIARHDKKHEIQVILVDNNSKDDIDCVYRKYVSILNDLTLVRQPKLPHTFALCRARNVGMMLARNTIVVNIDSDCMVNDTYFDALATAYRQDPSGLYVGERIFVDANKYTDDDIVAASQLDGLEFKLVPSTSNYGHVKDRRFPDILSLETSEMPCGLVHGGNMAYSLSRARALGGFDEFYDGRWGYEDHDFASRWQGPIRYVPGAEVYHQEPSVVAPYHAERLDKEKNLNWQRICDKVPGYKAFKEQQYAKLGLVKSV